MLSIDSIRNKPLGLYENNKILTETLMCFSLQAILFVVTKTTVSNNGLYLNRSKGFETTNEAVSAIPEGLRL